MNFELKLLVASLFATSASFGPFFSLFMQDKGFDALAIGTMISFSRVIMLLSTPAACAYADRHGVHRGLLAILATAAGFVILAFPLAPQGNFTIVALIFAAYSVCCGSKLAICDTIVLHACKGLAERYPLQRLWGSISWGVVAMAIGFSLRWYHAGRREQGLPVTYELVPVIHAAFQFCFATVLMTFIPPTAPSVPEPHVEADEHHSDSRSNNHTIHVEAVVADEPVVVSSPSTLSSLVSVDGTMSSVTCSTAISGNHSRRPQVSGRATVLPSSNATTTTAPASMFSVLRSYLRLSQDRRILFPILLGVSVLSLSEVAMNNFLFPYLRRALQAPPELFSYLLAIHSVSEVIAFTMGSRLMKAIGPRYLLIMSSLAFSTKAVWYSILTDAWTLLYVEMLHGVCFALMWTAAVAHVSRIAESLGDGSGEGGSGGSHNDNAKRSNNGTEKAMTNVRAASMAMTTLWFFANGLPNILGGVLSGYVVQNAETKEVALFQVVGTMSAVVAVMFWIYGNCGCFDADAPGASNSSQPSDDIRRTVT